MKKKKDKSSAKGIYTLRTRARVEESEEIQHIIITTTDKNSMNSAGEAQAESMRNGLEASQHAPGQQKCEGRYSTRPTIKDGSTTLKDIAKDIQIAKKGLEDEGVESTWLTVLEELAKRVRDASTTRQTPLGGVEERLKVIEESIKAMQKSVGTDQVSWAAVAIGNRGDVGVEHTTLALRPFIRATLA